MLRTDTKHAPANYVEDNHNSNLCSNHKQLVQDDTVLHAHQPHHLPPLDNDSCFLRHDQGGGGEGGHPQLYRVFQVLHPHKEHRALPPTDNSLSCGLAQASFGFSESRIWLTFSRTCSTQAMMLAINDTTGSHSYYSTLCCVMCTVPYGHRFQILRIWNTKLALVIVLAACYSQRWRWLTETDSLPSCRVTFSSFSPTFLSIIHTVHTSYEAGIGFELFQVRGACVQPMSIELLIIQSLPSSSIPGELFFRCGRSSTNLSIL